MKVIKCKINPQNQKNFNLIPKNNFNNNKEIQMKEETILKETIDFTKWLDGEKHFLDRTQNNNNKLLNNQFPKINIDKKMEYKKNQNNLFQRNEKSNFNLKNLRPNSRIETIFRDRHFSNGKSLDEMSNLIHPSSIRRISSNLNFFYNVINEKKNIISH